MAKRKRGRPNKAMQFVTTMQRLYRAGYSTGRVAQMLGFNRETVWRTLKKVAEPMRQRTSRICVECEKPSGSSRRCKLHRYLRIRELQREWYREKFKVKPENMVVL